MNPVSPELRLTARALLRIPDVAGLQLRCEEGTLWLTLDHDPRDIIVSAGETYTTAEHRAGLLYALQDARFSLCAPPAAQPGHGAQWPPLGAAAGAAA